MLLALFSFAFVTSVTPGPNNMMLLASGVNHGFKRSIPHMLGITFGFVVMLELVVLGIGQVLEANPAVFKALKVASVLYMLWLAWKIATSGPVGGDGDDQRGKPMSFLSAALFQWVNPKAWAIALTAAAAYTDPDSYAWGVVLIGLVFGIISVPSCGVWTLFGVALRKMLQDPRKVRIFNVAMAVLLALSMLPAVLDMAS
jgi:threonine/homoserine/homoserine lactone efflux protein